MPPQASRNKKGGGKQGGGRAAWQAQWLRHTVAAATDGEQITSLLPASYPLPDLLLSSSIPRGHQGQPVVRAPLSGQGVSRPHPGETGTRGSRYPKDNSAGENAHIFSLVFAFCVLDAMFPPHPKTVEIHF